MGEALGFDGLCSRISSGEFAPLYVLYGDETYLQQEGLKTLCEALVPEGLRDFNLQVFQEDASPEKVRDALEMLPMMSRFRVVVLKQGTEWSDKNWAELQMHLDNPIESSVFIVTGEKMDRRKKWAKALIQNGLVVELKNLYPDQIAPWVQKFASELSIKLPAESQKLLIERVGTSLIELRSEIVKLAAFVGRNQVASPEAVMQVVSKRRSETVFDFADAIANQDRAKALVCLADLLELGSSEIAILALLQRHFRILKITQEGLAEGLTAPKIAARAAIPPYFANKYISQAKKWRASMIDEAFSALLDTDRALKSSPSASHIWLENFVLRSCESASA